MKTTLETIFAILFIVCLLALVAGAGLIAYNVTKPIHPFIADNIGSLVALGIFIFLFILAMINMRRNYQLFLLIGDRWKLEGTFDSISDIHQYLDEHEELQFSDYKFKAI